jgi:hypothetical protein
MRGRMLTVLGVAASVASSASWVRADEPAAAPPPPIVRLGVTPGSDTRLPLPPSLKLTWPIAPVSFSFRGFDAGSTATGPLLAFEARSLWLQSGPLSLSTFAAALPTAALDCSGLTCQPTLMRSIGVDGRLHLYSGSIARETHAFARYESQWMTTNEPSLAQASKKRGSFSVGIGGALDL